MVSYQRLGRELWREQSRLYRESGLSQVEVSKQKNFALQTFKRWHCIFAHEAQTMAAPSEAGSISKLVPVILQPAVGPESTPSIAGGAIATRMDGCHRRVEGKEILAPVSTEASEADSATLQYAA